MRRSVTASLIRPTTDAVALRRRAETRNMAMNMSMRTPCTLLLLAAACAAQPPAVEPESLTPKEQVLRTLTAAGLKLDLEQRSVTMPARMGRPADLIEYLLIHRRGKSHESLFLTETQPSLLNAALLALDLTPGTNVTYKEKDPAPSEEEMRAGADWLIITPPKGTPVWFTVKWTDKDAKVHEVAVDDILMDVTTGEAVEGADWIYLGGRMAAPYRGEAPVFIADLEGNLVSTCYVEPTNHLVTLRHERARSDQNWWLTEACPPPETEVALTIHAKKPKLVVEREARIAKEKAAGKVPKGPPKELPVGPASGDSPPPIKRDK